MVRDVARKQDLAGSRRASVLLHEFRQKARQQLITFGVVIGRLREGDLVVRIFRQDHPEVISLNLFIARPELSARLVLNLGQHLPVLVIRRNREVELMIAVFGPHTREGFVILTDAFAAPSVRHAGLRHQIPFVTGVKEDLRLKRASVFHPDLGDSCALFAHAVPLLQAMLKEDGDFRFLNHLLKNLLGNMGFGIPLDLSAVMPSQPLVELQRVAADGLFPAMIRGAQSTGDHAAQVPARFEQGNLQTLARGGNGRNDAAARPTVDDDVKGSGLTIKRRAPKQADQNAG